MRSSKIPRATTTRSTGIHGARERGCIGVYLDTYSFQARPFYERHGYAVVGVLPDMPPGGAMYYLAKRLDSSVHIPE